jgi:hypothetical protein
MDNRRRQLIGGTAALTVAASVPAWAHDSAAHAPAARPQLGTGAAIDGQGRLWVARVEAAAQGGLANIMLSWSADQGKSWTQAGPALAAPEAVEANGEGRPKLAFGPRGQIYLTFTGPLSKSHTGYIRFARSLDGGQSFSAPVTVQRDLAVTTHRFDSIMLDRRGRIFIAWIDKRDGDAAREAKRPYRGAALYYAVSSDDGASFGPDVRVADHCCECCRIALALTPDGSVAAMWRHIFAPNVRDHAMAVLTPNGRPGGVTRVSFDDWRIDACPHHGPSFAFDAKGRRHQVWFSGGAEQGGLFYLVAGADGRAGKATRLGGARAEHGEVLAAGDTIALVWKEFDGEATRIMARWSIKGGAAWQERALASSRGASDHPHLVSHGSALWLVWRTVDEGVVVSKVEA